MTVYNSIEEAVSGVNKLLNELSKLEAENAKLWELVINVDYLMAQGYTDSFSNWVCPSELVFHLEQALAALLKEKGDE